jgi:hypothetical protein
MYRLVNSRADLDEVPGELRSLVGGCLAKHPDDRALQPAPGWLAESIMNSFIQDPAVPAAADLAGAIKPVAGTETSARSPGDASPPRSGRPRRGGTGDPGRHRISRPLASACLTGGLVAGSAVAAFALIGANHTPAASHLQPQAGAGAVATTPSSAASSNPTASPGASSSSAPSAAARVSPNMFLSPVLSRASSTSLPPTPIVSQSSAQPSASSKPSKPVKSSPPASTPPSSDSPSSDPGTTAPAAPST